MNEFLSKLADDRRAFLEGVKRNQGDINLDIFEDFYPDNAHFVYELLQNAEDAGATEAVFNLRPDACSFEHNGTRLFTADDVRRITGIHSSQKTEDQIGRFGVGFKSVFLYSLSPAVYSGEFSFEILDLIRPREIDPDSSLGERTRFRLPFDNPKKRDSAYAEIGAALRLMPETTLLFLRHLTSIRWSDDGRRGGTLSRVEHFRNHVEVSRTLGSELPRRRHYLRFSQPVRDFERQSVAVAFDLAQSGETSATDARKPTFDVVASQPAHVSVYFPAQKERSGLRFHVHGPFVPEVSRASIKDTPVNLPLFSQLAELVAASLETVRDMGLLTVDFLGVLPNMKDDLPNQYTGIREAVLQAMTSKRLVPMLGGGHGFARRLFQSKRNFKELISDRDLTVLAPDEQSPGWAAAAMQNTDADRFLSALTIRSWGADDLQSLLIRRVGGSPRYDESRGAYTREPDERILAWLSEKSARWHQDLYALLYDELDPKGGLASLGNCRIVRLHGGGHSVGADAFFASSRNPTMRDFPVVDPGVLEEGQSQRTKEQARKFLVALGVREIDDSVLAESRLKARYSTSACAVDEHDHWEDLKLFISMQEGSPGRPLPFANYFIFKGSHGGWHQPSSIYLDVPFRETGLRHWYSVTAAPAEAESLHESYEHSGIEPARLAMFAAAIGARTALRPEWTSCAQNPGWAYLQKAPGMRERKPTNQDWQIKGLPARMGQPTIERSRLIWNTMKAQMDTESLTAVYRRSAAHPAREAPSQLVHSLRAGAWVPQGIDRFVRPENARRGDLPPGFDLDPAWPWIQAIGFGSKATEDSAEDVRRRDSLSRLGLTEQGLLDAKRFLALAPSDRQRILSSAEQAARENDLPEHAPADPARRAQRVAEDVQRTPDRRSEYRTRAVSVGPDEAREAARSRLRAMYTRDDSMICQVCQDALPFKLANNEFYFETICFLREQVRPYWANYVALCPNHAAMFTYAKGSSDEQLIKGVLAFSGEKGGVIEIVLRERDERIYFTRTHIEDLRAMLTAAAEKGPDA